MSQINRRARQVCVGVFEGVSTFVYIRFAAGVYAFVYLTYLKFFLFQRNNEREVKRKEE